MLLKCHSFSQPCLFSLCLLPCFICPPGVLRLSFLSQLPVSHTHLTCFLFCNQCHCSPSPPSSLVVADKHVACPSSQQLLTYACAFTSSHITSCNTENVFLKLQLGFESDTLITTYHRPFCEFTVTDF